MTQGQGSAEEAIQQIKLFILSLEIMPRVFPCLAFDCARALRLTYPEGIGSPALVEAVGGRGREANQTGEVEGLGFRTTGVR